MQGGSTSPKAMRTAERARIMQATLNAPGDRVPPTAKKAPAKNFAGACSFYLENNSVATAWLLLW
jgi:hypothetical protein